MELRKYAVAWNFQNRWYDCRVDLNKKEVLQLLEQLENNPDVHGKPRVYTQVNWSSKTTTVYELED